MAKKIAEHRPDKGEREEVYPWLRLLELEVQPSERTMPHRGKGRPPNPFPRKAVHVTLTDEELATLDEMAELLSARFGRLHRGHLIAFLVFYLRSRLQGVAGSALPEELKTLTDLAQYLDQPGRK